MNSLHHEGIHPRRWAVFFLSALSVLIAVGFLVFARELRSEAVFNAMRDGDYHLMNTWAPRTTIPFVLIALVMTGSAVCSAVGASRRWHWVLIIPPLLVSLAGVLLGEYGTIIFIGLPLAVLIAQMLLAPRAHLGAGPAVEILASKTEH